jgi:hypothetical protein
MHNTAKTRHTRPLENPRMIRGDQSQAAVLRAVSSSYSGL